MPQSLASIHARITSAGAQALAVAATAVLFAVTHANASAAPAVIASASLSKQSVPSTGSSSSCPPAGFVRATEVGAGSLASILRNGETHYCVVSELSWAKRDCAKYLPAEEYIRHKIGRPDAVYSGMALDPGSHSNIILFYCLPPRKQ